VRYDRNEAEIALYMLTVAAFLSEVGDELALVQALHPEAA
jgi:hypothetical protein